MIARVDTVVGFHLETENRWLDDVTVRTLDLRSEVVGSTPGRVAIKWLVRVCRQVNGLGI